MPKKPHADQKYKNSGNEQDADDIFQDAILALLRMAEKKTFKLTVPLGGLLYYVYRNIWLDILKRKKKERTIIKELKLYIDDKVTLQVADKISKTYKRQKQLELCFEKLSDRCKQILSIRFEGCSINEMMIQLKFKTENAVSQSIFRCKTKLKECIETFQTN